MAKAVPVHRDLFDHELAVGDAVVYSQYNMLTVGNIVKINPKTIKVAKYRAAANKGWGAQESQQYPQDCIKINSADLTVWLLKGAKHGVQLRMEQKDKENG